ncbi:MAG: LysM peptidoglycan-binding domain-containing protein [Peptococcaceae bacterium]|nr:LysM peptidoglycan-binding domain-containing protein [Peptococcaceae bacterium]
MANTALTNYTVRAGDNFYLLAQKLGVGLDEVSKANPGVDSTRLVIGQIIKLPARSTQAKSTSSSPGHNSYAESSATGESFDGRNMDHVGVNIGGVAFEVKRVIDNSVPHEIHIILPKTEVHTVVRNPDCTLTETQVVIDNMDIVHSPRL